MADNGVRAGSPWRVGTVHSSHVITTNLSHRLSHNCHTSCHIFSHTNCRKRGYKSWNVPIFHKRCNQILSLTYQTSCQKLSLSWAHELPNKTVMTTKTAMMTVPGNNCKRRMSVTRTVMWWVWQQPWWVWHLPTTVTEPPAASHAIPSQAISATITNWRKW